MSTLLTGQYGTLGEIRRKFVFVVSTLAFFLYMMSPTSYILSDDNVNTGYPEPTRQSLAVQTTVEKLRTPNISVSVY